MTRWHISPYRHPEWLQLDSESVIFWVPASDLHRWPPSHTVNLSLYDIWVVSETESKGTILGKLCTPGLAMTHHRLSNRCKYANLYCSAKIEGRMVFLSSCFQLSSDVLMWLSSRTQSLLCYNLDGRWWPPQMDRWMNGWMQGWRKGGMEGRRHV